MFDLAEVGRGIHRVEDVVYVPWVGELRLEQIGSSSHLFAQTNAEDHLRLDMLIAGYENQLRDSQVLVNEAHRVIPSADSPVTNIGPNGERPGRGGVVMARKPHRYERYKQRFTNGVKVKLLSGNDCL